jgi:hypothetical protein
LQKAGASSENNALPPRDVTAEVIVARKALVELLLERADGADSPSSYSAQDPYLAVVLDFIASLVADLAYTKKFMDESIWHRCVGVYIAPWLPDRTDGAATFAELVCKHFYTIEKVSLFQAFDLQFTMILTGQAHTRQRWGSGRGRDSLQHSLLPRLWCPSPSIAHDPQTIPRAPLRYTGCERIWEVDPYAPTTGWKSRELSASGPTALCNGRTLTPR